MKTQFSDLKYFKVKINSALMEIKLALFVLFNKSTTYTKSR